MFFLCVKVLSSLFCFTPRKRVRQFHNSNKGVDMRMLVSGAAVLMLMLSGCGAHYTIPNENEEIDKVVSSGVTPNGCIENLKEDAQKLNVKVRLTDVNHEPSPPFGFLFSPSWVCTGKVVKGARS